MAQDFYDILQPFEYVVGMLKDHQPDLGIAYVAENDEALIPQYPAVLVQAANTERSMHATGMFLVEFNLDLWLFHAELTVGTAIRSRQNADKATQVRKLLHSDATLGGHIIFSYVSAETPGVSARVVNRNLTTMVTTRLTWVGQNRVPFEAS